MPAPAAMRRSPPASLARINQPPAFPALTRGSADRTSTDTPAGICHRHRHARGPRRHVDTALMVLGMDDGMALARKLDPRGPVHRGPPPASPSGRSPAERRLHNGGAHSAPAGAERGDGAPRATAMGGPAGRSPPEEEDGMIVLTAKY